MEEESGCSFEALPVECASLVLSKCCPRDIGRLSCVSRAWESAAAANLVWEKWLVFKDRFQDRFPCLQEARTGKQVFDALRLGAFSESRGAACKEYLLTVDVHSGSLSLHVSAFRCLYFYQRNDTKHDLDNLRITPYGLWPTSAVGSTFENSAALAAGLFHIRGEICPEFELPAGKYGLSFKMALPPPLHEDALFPAVCLVNNCGEPDTLINTSVNLHRDGAPTKCNFKISSKADEVERREPEFWAKSPCIEREQETAWETINTMFLSAYSYFNAEVAWKMQLSGERVKPWKKRTEPLRWEEFPVGSLEIKDEGDGCGALAVDVVLTDVECYTFQGPIWLDSVVITQMP